jgi:hypothetical protein
MGRYVYFRKINNKLVEDVTNDFVEAHNSEFNIGGVAFYDQITGEDIVVSWRVITSEEDYLTTLKEEK